MHRRLIALPLILALGAASAARADTILDLSETATISAQPDEIAASLRAEAIAPAPAPAQEAVNRVMASALQNAHQLPDLTASTGAYSVWLPEPAHPGPPTGWHASQSLELTSHDGKAMLALVGALQSQGMAVQSLAWRLSPETTRSTHAAALRQAVSGLRTRAEEAAGLLNLRFASFRTVRLTPEPPRAFPMAMRAAGFAAPSVEQGPVEVSATVTAEAVLVGP
ncbi:MAG: SIMPL domain-containing protein [Acetobacteraceae bacterium]